VRQGFVGDTSGPDAPFLTGMLSFPTMEDDNDQIQVGGHKLIREHIVLTDRVQRLTDLEERRQNVYLWMEIYRFGIAGILTLAAIIVGMIIFFYTEDPTAKTWALSLMQAAFFAGIGYSFGSGSAISSASVRSKETNSD
jgi:hypothetical protein